MQITNARAFSRLLFQPRSLYPSISDAKFIWKFEQKFPTWLASFNSANVNLFLAFVSRFLCRFQARFLTLHIRAFKHQSPTERRIEISFCFDPLLNAHLSCVSLNLSSFDVSVLLILIFICSVFHLTPFFGTRWSCPQAMKGLFSILSILPVLAAPEKCPPCPCMGRSAQSKTCWVIWLCSIIYF